jgi:hypothetical protein
VVVGLEGKAVAVDKVEHATVVAAAAAGAVVDDSVTVHNQRISVLAAGLQN